MNNRDLYADGNEVRLCYNRDEIMQELERLTFLERTAEVQRDIGWCKQKLGSPLSDQEIKMLEIKAKIYQGQPCRKCGNKIRYLSSRNCIDCTRN